MDARPGDPFWGKGYGLFAAAFAVLLAVIVIIGRLGLGDRLAAALVLAAAAGTFIALGVGARTLRLSDFLIAGRRATAGANGAAAFAAMLGAGGATGLIGLAVGGADATVHIAAGSALGLAVLAAWVGPRFRASGAATLPDFMAVRYGRLARAQSLLIVLAIAAALAPGALAAAAMIAAALLGVDFAAALAGTVVIVVASTLFGGMRAVTRVAGTQAIVILFAALVPAAALLLGDNAMPLLLSGPPVGGLAAPAFDAAADTLDVLTGFDRLDWLGFALALAAGTACLPQLLCRSATADSVEVRRSWVWALALLIMVAFAAPALATLARAALVRDLVGTDFADLPAWLFAYGSRGLIEVCGADAVSPAALGKACGAATVLEGLTPDDIVLARSAILPALSGIAGLPAVLSALIGAGALAVATATANTVLIAAAAAIPIERRASDGRRLILTRLTLLGLTGLAAWAAAQWPGEMLALASLAPALAASAFFGAVVIGARWKAVTSAGALAGMAAGFGAVAVYVLAVRLGITGRWTVLGLGDGIADAAVALIGVPIGLATTLAVSLLPARESEKSAPIVDTGRRPAGDPSSTNA